jgi:nucleotide-binding universal stress UspA family protein
MESARATLDAVGARASAAGVRVRTVVMHGDRVGGAIVAAANKHRSDLIVMASHGRTGLNRILLGSQTQYVLDHSLLPVLVLR